MPEITLEISQLQWYYYYFLTISHKKRVIHGNPLQISFKKENPEMENKNEKELYQSHLAIHFP